MSFYIQSWVRKYQVVCLSLCVSVCLCVCLSVCLSVVFSNFHNFGPILLKLGPHSLNKNLRWHFSVLFSSDMWLIRDEKKILLKYFSAIVWRADLGAPHQGPCGPWKPNFNWLASDAWKTEFQNDNLNLKTWKFLSIFAYVPYSVRPAQIPCT